MTVATAVLRGRVLPPREKVSVLSTGQRIALVLVVAGLVVASLLAPLATLVVVNTALVLFFVAANVMKLFLISRALDSQPLPGAKVVRHPWFRLADSTLPIYTILLPVYHEAEVFGQLLQGIRAIDYPEDRLDVKLLLEEDDRETRAAAEAVDLPAFFDVLVVPDVGPKGKPRACNHGLQAARGDYIVIYDAEDRPEPDQLRRCVEAFRNAPESIVCLQAKLNYFNRTHNVLTRWFTAEYSVWFDQLLPGLQSLDVVIPLGGTSNHFMTEKLREIGGWNSYNVTEDADLGVRIFLREWKTAVLDSTTYEEATSRYHNWLRQRSRWAKGYMQTYLLHMRKPVDLMRRMGPKAFIAFQLFFGAGTLCLLLNPLYWFMTALWFMAHVHLIQLAFPQPVFYAGIAGLFLGNAACTLSAVSGCFARQHYEDVKWAFLVPIYWVLMSIAAWKALIQLTYKPSYWEKTIHGYCRIDDEPLASSPGAATVTSVA